MTRSARRPFGPEPLEFPLQNGPCQSASGETPQRSFVLAGSLPISDWTRGTKQLLRNPEGTIFSSSSCSVLFGLRKQAGRTEVRTARRFEAGEYPEQTRRGHFTPKVELTGAVGLD